VLALAGVVVTAAHAAGPPQVIGRVSTAPGQRVAAVTAGAQAPRALSVRIVAKPPQKVTVTSSVICSKAGAQGNLAAPEHEMDTAIKSTKFSARAPLTRRLALPIPHPRSWCSVALYSTLQFDGRETVTVLSG
jgi:hypothetical protein